MDADLLALLRAVEAAGYRAWNRNYGMQCPKCQHSRRHHKKARPPAFVRSSTISRVARRDNCRRLDHEDDAFFGCPRAMHHALWDDQALIGQELDGSPLEINYESA